MATALRGLIRMHGAWAALLVAMLFIAAPGAAQAQATCAIDFSANYNATNVQHVLSMTQNFDETQACDPRFVANQSDPASGVRPTPQSGATANGGSFTAVTNAADDTITYNAPTGFSGVDTFTVTFCNDASCTGSLLRTATVSVTVGTPTIVVNPATLPNATVAAAYSQTLTGSGGNAPYGSFTVISGALPAGLSLAANGALTGTPTASGVFNFTIRTTDSSTGNGPFQGSRAYTLTVNAPTVVVNPTTLPNATVGAAYSQTMTGAGGTAPYGSFTVTVGALPAGLTLAANGALTGTPTAGGSFNFTIRTTDSTTGTGPHNGSRAYTLTVNAPTITVNPTTLPAGTQGSAYSQTFTASGGTSPYTFAVTSGSLPAGLTLAAGGALTGTPTVNGSFPITVTATDASTGSGPYTGSRGYTLVINAPPAPVADAVSQTVGYNSTNTAITLNITGGTPTSVATPGLPAHGTVNVVGTTITYTPTTNYGGPDSFTYTATNAGGTSAPATVTITVSAPTITVSPTTLPDGTTGVAYSQSVSASGGSGSYTYAITSGTQPTGLLLSAAGVLSGTPSGTGPYTFTVTATDTSTGNGPYTGARAYTVTIITPDPAIANPVSATVAYNSVNNPITLNITGGAPTSVAVSTPAGNGTATAVGTSITYTPTTGYFGPDSFAYTATNADGTSAPATVTITVNPQPPIAGAVSASVAQDSSNNPITLNITGGTPVSIAASAQTNGTTSIAGTSITFTPTPGYNGPASFSYTATNAGGTSAPATVSITVNPLPPVAGAVSATVAYGSNNNPITLNLTGGTPTSVAIGTPASNGTASAVGTSITYTPTPGYFGPDSFTYTATNGGGTSAPATVTITVNPQIPVAGAVSVSVAEDSVNNPITLNITGGTPTSVAASAQVNGTTSVAGTSITFTPTPGYNGPASFSYTATNAGGASAPATVSITVNPYAPIANAVSATVAFESSNNPITLNITGGTPVSLATPTLPTHGTVNIAGLAITYTPTAGYAGPDSFTYTATNTGGTSAPATVSITVNPPPPPVTDNVSATVSANSSANPITLSITGGTPVSLATPTLPTHGTVNIAGLTITYTPTAGYSGADSFTYTATNLGGTSAPSTVSVTVSAPTLTLSALTTTGQVTAAYSSTVTASLGTAPYGYAVTAGALPTGLTLSTGGVLSGTATAAGVFNFTVTATDTYGATGSQAYAVTIDPPTVTITSPAAGALPSVEAYGAYSETFTIAGGAAPRTVALTAGALPAGLGLTSAGVLSGTPTTPGTYNFTLTPSDGSVAPGPYDGAPVAYSLTVTAPTIALAPAAGALPAATTALAYSQTFTASGGIGPYGYTLAAGALPTGLSLSGGGVLSGTPTAAGTYNFTIEAADSHSFTGSTAYSITVSDPTVAVTAPAAGALPSVEAYGSYSETFTASGGIGPRTFAVTAGALPPGIGLTSGGALSGTPTTPGTYNFSVTATDSSGAPGPFNSAPVAYSITVTAPTIALAPAAGALPAATTALAYSQTFTATGGIGPHSYSVTAGAIPTGLSLTGGGVLSGTPTAAGTYNFTITGEDSHGFTAANAYSITVADPTVAVTAPAAGALPSVEAYGSYSETFTASGGIGPRTFAVTAGALPPGIGLTSGGALSGTPTTPGTYNFSIAASDSSGAPGPFTSAPVAYSITVTAPTITLSPAAGALPPATTALAYSQTFTASGGIGPHSYSVTAGALPAGLGLSSGGVLSGTPTAAGTFNFTVTGEDSHGFTAANAYAITVTDPVITVTAPAAGALPSVEAYATYSETFTATGGIGPRTFAVTAGALPAGLALSSGGVLSGAPTTPGTYNFSITASDSSGAPGPFSSTPVAYSVTVTAPTVSLAPAAGALPAATTALTYSQIFTASGGVGPYGYAITAGALPPGLTLAGGGALSGAPTAAGTYNFTVTATDSHGFSAANAYAITATDPIVTLTSPAAGALPSVEAYATYSETFTATGGIGPRTFAVTAGALPAGLALSSGGVLSGAATTPGTYNFSVTASDSSGAPGPFTSAPVAYSITVTAPTVGLAPAAGPLAPATTAQPYSETFTASGGVGPYSYAVTAGALPPGLTLAGGGALSGAPTAAGTYNFTVTATDSHGFSASNAYSITDTDPVVTLTAPAAGPLPGATAYASYSQTFTATGGVAPRTFAVTAGALPAGLSLSAAGVLSGTPTAAGSFTFSIAASDSSGAPGPFVSAPVAYSLDVAAPTVTITAPAAGALPGATASAAYSQTFTAAGGSGTHSFAVTAGALPAGLSLSGAGVLSGTPTTPGTYNFSLTASDTSVAPGPFSSAPVAYSITVAAPTVAITAPAAGALPDVVAFTAVNQTFTATGGAGAHSFALTAGALPAGVTLSSAGVLSGTPTATGTYNFTVTASDSSGAPGPFTSAPAAYSLTVTAPTLAVTPPALPDAVTEVVFGEALSGAGGTAPYSFALTAGALPPGITLASNGAISGDPTTAGTYNFTVTVTDANGFTGLRAYSLVVVQAVPVAEPDTASTPANQAVAIPVTANDTGVITSIAVAGAPANGTATVSGLDVTYTPNANYFGVDSFTYTATGPGGTSTPAVVTVTVTPLAVPTAAPKTLTVLSGQTASVLATDGSTGAPITAVAIAAAPAHGTATVAGQDLVYTPTAGYSGTDSFTYTLANPFGVSAPATVTVTVNPAPITAAPITVEILSGQTASVSLTTGATGGPFTAAALVSLTPPAAGTATITNPGAGQYGMTFTPAGEFAGTVTATYTLSNAFATSAPGTVTIIVTARPDPTSDPEVTGLIGAQDETARRFATAQISNFNSRLESLRDGGGGGTSLGLGFSGGSRDLVEELDSTTRRRMAELGLLDGPMFGVDRVADGGGTVGGDGGANAYGGGGSGSGRIGLWAAGMVDFGQRDATSTQKGVKFTTDGLTAGADLRFGDQLVVGAGIGWGHDESRVGHNGTRSEADGYSFALYGSYQPDKTFFIDGVLGYGTLEFDSRRYITATGDFALGQRDGSQWFGAVTGGWDMREGGWLLSPYGRLTATRSELDAFDETTGGPYALHYDSQTVRTLTGTFGLRGAYGYRIKLGEITPRFRFEYSHDFEGSGRSNISYVDWVGGPVYGVYAAPLAQNRILGGLGLDILTTGGTRFTIDYETMLGSGSEQQTIRLQIQTRF